MQLVLSKNRIIAHGENFLAMGGVVINTETGARYENATVAECENCPSDIDKVGYEYHAGVFVPCAPYGVGNNNGFFMEVCESCATPRSSGIPIKGGLKEENFSAEALKMLHNVKLLWENGSSSSSFAAQTITLESEDWDLLIIEQKEGGATVVTDEGQMISIYTSRSSNAWGLGARSVTVTNKTSLKFEACSEVALNFTSQNGGKSSKNDNCVPTKVYGVKL